MQIKPLVKPTRAVINFKGLQYAWHDFVSKSMSILLFLQISQCLFFFLFSNLGSYNISLLCIWKKFPVRSAYLFVNINTFTTSYRHEMVKDVHHL